jgi:anthranilate/para-aminobenzoate synthase component II
VELYLPPTAPEDLLYLHIYGVSVRRTAQLLHSKQCPQQMPHLHTLRSTQKTGTVFSYYHSLFFPNGNHPEKIGRLEVQNNSNEIARLF